MKIRDSRAVKIASAALLSIMVIAPGSTHAAQIPDDSPVNGMQLTFPSGLTTTMSETGITNLTPAELTAQGWSPLWNGGMRQAAYFGSLGEFATSPYSLPQIESSQQTVWYSTTFFGLLWPFTRTLSACPITATRGVEMRCPRDTVTFTFSRPVTDPVLHLNNIGANSYSDNNEWDNQRLWVHSHSIYTLDLANSTYSGTPSITKLSSVGAFDVVNDGSTYHLDPSDSRLDGAPAITRTSASYISQAAYVPGAFGAGSVTIKGTWTSITFNRDLLWIYDTYSPTNSPHKVGVANYFSQQANNECVLGQLPASTMYFCSLSGSTWSPDVTKVDRSWDHHLAAQSVKDAIQIENPAPEGVSYLITVNEDFGTAPATYDQTNGASHVLSNLKIGSAATSTGNEITSGATAVNNSGASGIVSPNASGTDASDDAFSANPVLPSSGDYTATIPLSGITAAAKLCGWIDSNANGLFDTGERQCAAVSSGATSASLTWPSSLVQNISTTAWMRLRLSYDTTGVESPLGRLDSGEVEDWKVSSASYAASQTTTTTSTTQPSTTTTVAPSTSTTTTTVSKVTTAASMPKTGADSVSLVMSALGLVVIGYATTRSRRRRVR